MSHSIRYSNEQRDRKGAKVINEARTRGSPSSEVVNTSLSVNRQHIPLWFRKNGSQTDPILSV